MAKKGLQGELEPIKLDEKKKKSLGSRVLIGALLAVVGIPTMMFGGWFFFALIMIFFLFAIYEFLKLPGKKYHWVIWAFTYIITISYVLWVYAKANVQAYQADPDHFVFALESEFIEPGLSWYAIIVSLGFYCAVALISKTFDFHDVMYLFTMTILVGFGFQSILFLRYHPFFGVANPDNFFRWVSSAFLFAFVVIATFGNDTMAYFVGIFFGHHNMHSPISPNKSWEGFFGGWILGGLLAFGFATIVEACGHPILDSLRIFGPDSKWWGVVILSFTLPLIGTLGDFTFSLIKRTYNVKDYGKLLGAHGGVLDRVDSLIFCCIAASILLVIIQKGAGFFI